MPMTADRKFVLQEVEAIDPFDSLEVSHQADVISWIQSGTEIYRIQKPAVPLKHLVAYFIVVDRTKMKLLLVDHIKAQLWLPTGGHVEPHENPRDTVRREIQEELHMEAEFITDEPVFVTETTTVGLTPGHIDVSLWYVVSGDSKKEIDFDRNEFKACRWFSYEEILNEAISKLDPHMHRFVRKWLNASGKHSVTRS